MGRLCRRHLRGPEESRSSRAWLRSASAAQLARSLVRVGWSRIADRVRGWSTAANLARAGDVLAFGPRRGAIPHADKGLTSNTRYSYRVRAANDYWVSGYTNIVGAHTP